ncbi:unnamed protein product [Parnassius apollo]|uniref:(apollo) hypothetical protein n=1 Tax=Parnassius apollo TaxID=110799 RepID=A0A8S3W0T1_PARAO|nr:unnamed protein product [Parnassius apollo]
MAQISSGFLHVPKTKQIQLNGYRYGLQFLKKGKGRWRCVKQRRGCKAVVVTVDGTNMNFKIVATVENGERKLSIVPSLWETNGELRRPKERANITRLVKDKNSRPLPDWHVTECVMKLSSIPSYEQAEKELCILRQHRDADVNNRTQEHVNATTNNVVVNNEERTPNLSATANPTSVPLVTTLALDNQKKHKLAGLSVPIKDVNTKRDRVIKTPITLSKSIPTESDCVIGWIITNPIESVSDLKEMDSFLSNIKHRCKLIQQYSQQCSQLECKGVTCAYKMLDLIFSRKFLYMCSWTGGSRSDELKIGFKSYKNILKFYFELIHSWDSTYTMQDNENFFKDILKNSAKKSLTRI